MFKGKLERLRCSFEVAKAAGYEKFIMFLHYPPTSIGEMDEHLSLVGFLNGKLSQTVHRMSFNRFLYNKTV